ncbi:hypothetical protein A33K_13435 [Burkholderia humptydooensis MSMB43]|uniref:Uncharacterized protein n=1 Tax=Burkholderia humptydooensis MSMB43 TaxID=441157 RepID=A0ABN0GC79_9BURK|nr:hypothetical protein A33K_13435 [Burkholderia humptydooensis MSMB43]
MCRAGRARRDVARRRMVRAIAARSFPIRPPPFAGVFL